MNLFYTVLLPIFEGKKKEIKNLKYIPLSFLLKFLQKDWETTSFYDLAKILDSNVCIKAFNFSFYCLSWVHLYHKTHFQSGQHILAHSCNFPIALKKGLFPQFGLPQPISIKNIAALAILYSLC